jgi:hypothetical protein
MKTTLLKVFYAVCYIIALILMLLLCALAGYFSHG